MGTRQVEVAHCECAICSELFASEWLVSYPMNFTAMNYFLKVLLIFRERGRERKREGEKHRLSASHVPPTRDLACNPGMCPDQESNQRPFSSQAGTQPTEPHQPELNELFFK